MRIDKSIIAVIVGTFLVGCLLAFAVEFRHDPLLVSIDPEGTPTDDTELNNCDRYVFSIVGSNEMDFSEGDVKWRINGEYHHEEVAEEPFFEQGPQNVKLYVGGRLRADTTVMVGACDMASVLIPSSITRGETHILDGSTKDAVTWSWYMDGEPQVDRDGDDSKLTYTFLRAAQYDLRLEVTTVDGETKQVKKKILVQDIKKEPVNYADREPVRREEIRDVDTRREEVRRKETAAHVTQTNTTTIEEVPEKIEPEVEPEPEPEEEENTYVPPGQAFGDFDGEDFSAGDAISFITKTKCADYNSAPGFATITNITTDLCLTHIHVLPDPELKSNEVEITIAHSDPSKGRPRKLTRVAQSSNNPYPIGVESIGCGLLKGERYTITVRPKGEYRFGEIGIGSTCYDPRSSRDYVEIDLGDKTKILGLTFRHD